MHTNLTVTDAEPMGAMEEPDTDIKQWYVYVPIYVSGYGLYNILVR